MIVPIGDRVLVRPKSPEGKSKGGILLAKVEETQDQGEVLSVGDGPGVNRFKPGDILVYQKYGPAKVVIDKDEFVIVSLDEILGGII